VSLFALSYGFPPRSPLSYLDFVGMFLNRDIGHYVRAEPVLRGVLAAHSTDNVPMDWFLSLTDGEGEASRLEQATNTERILNRADHRGQ
jgi:hypothetical protein